MKENADAIGVKANALHVVSRPGIYEPTLLQEDVSAKTRLPARSRICFYNHTGQVSGAEKVLFSVLSALDPDTCHGVVFAPSSRLFKSVCRLNGLEFRPVTALNARYTLNPSKLTGYLFSVATLIRELRTQFLNERPDLIHANTTRAAIVATLATVGTKIPVLWYVHDILPRHPLSSAVRMLAVLSGRNRIIAVSRATGKAFTGKLPQWLRSRAPVEVVHNSTDTVKFNLSREGASSFLQEVGLNNSHFRIGIVGQITRRKGHLEMIRALAPVFQTVLPHGRLLVVGSAMFNNDKAYLELLKSETQRLGVEHQVLFLGPRDVPVVMKALSVLVLNSSTEPFGLVLTEAMATGTPVVAASVDGVPEIVENGVSGLLFNPGDFDTLIAHLLLLSRDSDSVERLSYEGRLRVERLFDQTSFQAKVLRLYEKYSGKEF